MTWPNVSVIFYVSIVRVFVLRQLPCDLWLKALLSLSCWFSGNVDSNHFISVYLHSFSLQLKWISIWENFIIAWANTPSASSFCLIITSCISCGVGMLTCHWLWYEWHVNTVFEPGIASFWEILFFITQYFLYDIIVCTSKMPNGLLAAQAPMAQTEFVP